MSPKPTLPVVCILAGGLGTRLGPLADATPKAIVEVAGEPFLRHQLRLLGAHRARRIVLCVGHLGERVEEAIGDGSELGLEISYAYDPPGLAGTAGAVRGALPLLEEEFLVLYGDTYLRIDYAAFARAFAASGRSAQLSVLHNEGRWDTSNTEVDGDLVRRHDKERPDPAMEWIDYGLSAFRADVFRTGSGHRASDLSPVFRDLAAAGQLAAFPASERFYEIGTPAALAETAAFLAALDQ